MNATQSQVSSNTRAKVGNGDDHEYDSYIARVAKRFAENTAGQPLLTTDAYKRHDTALWDAYLDSFPAEERQFHNCSCCRHFIQRYGSLVVVKDGRTVPAVWDVDDAPELYKPAVTAMARLVRRAKITGVFLSELVELGDRSTRTEACTWRHFAVYNPTVFKRTVKTAKQAMAEKREDRNTVARALSEFTPTMLTTAVQLLKSDALYRSEKVLGQAEWLLKLAEAHREVNRELRENELWREIALAPAGFCHPRSSMIGTLLEDIEQGLPYEVVARKFADKMAPTRYQRPQAAPSAGNIAQAEKLVEQMGIEPSLRRRFARLDEVQALWKPATKGLDVEGSGGVFAHLKPKGEAPTSALRVPAQTMTWEKFKRTVLPDAKSIELNAPIAGNYCALVTAEDPAAPPILQWDTLEQRNPVSWYMYVEGSSAAQWNISPGWRKVTAVTTEPSSWFGAKLDHHAAGVLFILDGARDTRSSGSGLALFPETLKSELRAVRSTIEAFSKKGTISGADQASACGLVMQKSSGVVHLRVVSASGVTSEYRIDRMV